MPVQPTYRPHHLALAIALALGCANYSMAEDILINTSPSLPATPEQLIAQLDAFAKAADTHLTSVKKVKEWNELSLDARNDLVSVQNKGMFKTLVDGGEGKNVLQLNSGAGGVLGETRNFVGLEVQKGLWTVSGTGDFSIGALIRPNTTLVNDGHIIGGAITQGTLINNRSIGGNVFVDKMGSFSGSGNVHSLDVHGELAVNRSHGAPKVAGNLHLSNSATLSYEVAPEGHDKAIKVGGIARLGDATLKIVAAPGDYKQTNQYTIIEANEIDGRFGNIENELAYMTPSLQYEANTVGLTFARNNVPLESLATSESGEALGASIIEPPTSPQIQTPTEGAGTLGEKVTDAAATPPTSTATGSAAPAQQTTASTNAAVTALLTSDKATAAYALDVLAGDGNAHLANATLNSDAPITATLLSAMRQLDTAGFFDNPNRAPRFAAGNGDNGRVWLQALGHSGKLDRDYDPLHHSTQGLVLGADWRIDEHWRLGVMGGQSRTRQKSRELEGDLDSWHIGAYALRQDGPMSIRLGATHNSHDGSSARRVEFHGFKDRPKGRYDASTQQAFAEVGYNLGRASFSVEPFASVGYQRYQRDGFSEKGGDAALKVHGQSEENFSSTFGLRLAKLSTFDNGMQLVPRVSAGWKHAYGKVYTETRQRLVKGGNDYSVYSAPLDRNTLMVDAGMDLKLSKRNTLGIALTGEMGSDSRSHGVTGQWRMSF